MASNRKPSLTGTGKDIIARKPRRTERVDSYSGSELPSQPATQVASTGRKLGHRVSEEIHQMIHNVYLDLQKDDRTVRKDHIVETALRSALSNPEALKRDFRTA